MMTIEISVELIICFVGVFFFGAWLLKTSLGKNALKNRKPRRNDMPIYLIFLPFFLLFGVFTIFSGVISQKIEEVQTQTVVNSIFLSIGYIITIVIIIYLAKKHFVRGLKGFGLRFDKIHIDFPMAFLNLFTAWPLIMATLIVTTQIGRLFMGPDYQIEAHQSLELLQMYDSVFLKILICIVAVVLAPIVEELIFRGLFQSYILSLWRNKWLAVAASSSLFAIIHANASHWFVIFFLGICLGYAYEKSGSIIRSILIHSIFNGMSIISVLTGL